MTETVEISIETAEVAWFELETLIKVTEDQDPDPLTDRVFQARSELKDALTQGDD